MIGRELLQRLSSLSEAELDLAVETEGCDCDGDVADVTVEYSDTGRKETIYLRRSSGSRYI